MPLDYFSDCKTTSSKKRFGICDDPSPLTNPAYLDESDSGKWIGIVNNSEEKEINFNAIDHCLNIRRQDNSRDSKCDGVLSYDNNLIFVELKEKGSRGSWLGQGRKQITATIDRFKKEVDVNEFNNIKGHVCNSLRPLAHYGQAQQIQQFKDETGYILYSTREIDL